MNEYHKIVTVLKRDPATKHKTLIDGEYALPEFKYLEHNSWVFTEKVDGTNIRIMWDGSAITFGGKTDNAQIHAQLLNTMNETILPKRDLFADFLDGPACLYCEGYGARIQKGGGNYRPDQSVSLFDIKIGDFWLKRDDVEDIGRKLGFDVVPEIGFGTLPTMLWKAKEGFQSQWGDFLAEGIVARPLIELKTRSGHRIIAKIKHKDFQ